jgi:hypothetical protein
MLFFNSVVDVIVARAAADHTNAIALLRGARPLRSGVLGVLGESAVHESV